MQTQSVLTAWPRSIPKVFRPLVNIKLPDLDAGGMIDFLALRREMQEGTGVEFRDKQVLNELSGCGITRECGIDAQYGDPSSYWSIANAYTAVSTHGIDGPRSSDVSARIVDWMVARAEGIQSERGA